MLLEKIKIINELNIVSVLVRITLAVVLGGLMGIEREQKQRPAGFRTYIVVCLGATLASLTNVYVCSIFENSDPSRIPAQVISGIGFLGAGTILVTRNNHIKGLTTAAGLWCAASIGIAVGCGFYSGAIISCFVIVCSLRMLQFVDNKFSRYNKYINIFAEYESSTFIRNLIKYTKSNDFELHDLEIYNNKEIGTYCATFSVKVLIPQKRQSVIDEMKQFEGLVMLEELVS